MKKFSLYILAIIILFFSIYIIFDLVPNISTSTKLKGIDISHHNDIEDWSELKNRCSLCYAMCKKYGGIDAKSSPMRWVEEDLHFSPNPLE